MSIQHFFQEKPVKILCAVLALVMFWEVGPVHAMEKVLRQGWNLVSVPEEQADTDPAAVLGSIDGNYDEVVAYDAFDAIDPWKSYDPSDQANSDLTTMDHRWGYWVHMLDEDTLVTFGSVPVSTSVPIQQGWNLIGYANDDVYAIDTTMVSIKDGYDRVFTYAGADTIHPVGDVIPGEGWDGYKPSTPLYANDLQLMKPGFGYWLHALTDTTLIITDPAYPVLDLTVPANGVTLTAPTAVVGTVTSPTLKSWTLEYQSIADTEWISFTTGTQEVTYDTLGIFDPTLLLNGLYRIRLSAEDLFEQISMTEVDVVVDGGMKVGNFTVSFMDLSIPVAGIPIQITRTYDSRKKTSDDFGTGWSLNIRNVKLQESTTLGEGWKSARTTSGMFWTNYWVKPTRPHIVTVTTTDGSMHTFDFTLGQEYWQLYPPTVVFPKFEPRPGTTSTLEQKNPQEVIVNGGFSTQWQPASLIAGLGIFDPSNYILTLKNGTQLEISDIDGLDILRDRNENTLQITENGIIYSSGKSVDFTRDSEGRITTITDPMGNIIDYAFDANNDLVSVTDQENYTTSFAYDSDHYLIEITDPRGITPARQLYDDDGRMIAMVDAENDTIHMTHNLDQRQEIVKDRLGHITIYTYDNFGNVTSKMDAKGNLTTYTYDDHGNKLSETDPDGNSRYWTFDDQDNMLSETNPLGNTTSYTYNECGQMTSKTDPLDNVWTYAYDAEGNKISETLPSGYVVHYAHDAQGNTISEYDDQGDLVTNEYDTHGNILKTTNALGYETFFTYDDNGNQLTQTKTRTTPNGVETLTVSKVYDDLNRVIQITDAEGAIIVSVFNAIGKADSIKDRNGNWTQYFYTDKGDTARIVYADTTEEIYIYDSEDRKIAFTDRGGRTTTYDYDNGGNLIKTTYHDGSFITNEYDKANRLVKKIDQRGNETLYSFDEAGRNITVTDALGNVTTYGYDSNNNKTSMIDALDHTTLWEYDAYGRIIKTTMHDGTFTETKYDILGRAESYREQGGIITRYTHNFMGQLVAVKDTLGQTTRYEYDEVGNQIKVIDANSNETLMEYDNMGRMTKKTLPEGIFESWTWDGNGNMLSHTDYNSNTIFYEYDSNDQLVKKTFPDLTEEVYTYTASGQRESVADARGVTFYDYDNMDRLLTQINPDGTSILYTYDNGGCCRGLKTSMTVPSGTTNYEYDDLNRLIRVIDPQNKIIEYEYDAVGNKIKTIYPNGTRTEYSYNDLNRLTDLLNIKSNGDTISYYHYTLGPNGNRTQVQEYSSRVVNYTYDLTYRLLEEEIFDPDFGMRNISFAYDSVGNRLYKVDNGDTIWYSYDSNNRLLTENSQTITISYSYDNNGSMISKVANGVVTNYTYDYQQRLRQVNNGTDIIDYVYDADGIRTEKIIGSESIKFLVDKNRNYAQVIEERNGQNDLIVAYNYGDDLISQKRSSLTSYYHYDGQLSTRQLTDSTGIITDGYTYDAFGILLNKFGATENNYMYTGEQFDPNIGFYYLRARYYNQNIGRFITVDPWKGSVYDPVSLHKYLYVGNNPINYWDPSGLMTLMQVTITVSIIGILAGIAVPLFTFHKKKEDLETCFFNCIDHSGVYWALIPLGISSTAAIVPFKYLINVLSGKKFDKGVWTTFYSMFERLFYKAIQPKLAAKGVMRSTQKLGTRALGRTLTKSFTPIFYGTLSYIASSCITCWVKCKQSEVFGKN